MTQMPPTIPGPMVTREVPGATASLVLGIIPIVINIPVVGLILALIGLSKARVAKAMCDARPGYYTNAGVAQAGMILCIIGTVLGGLSTLCGCGYFAFIGLMLVGAAAGGGANGP
jgi:hypothetical protein